MTKFTDQQLIELYNKNENFQSLYAMKCVDLDTKSGTIQFEFDIQLSSQLAHDPAGRLAGSFHLFTSSIHFIYSFDLFMSFIHFFRGKSELC